MYLNDAIVLWRKDFTETAQVIQISYLFFPNNLGSILAYNSSVFLPLFCVSAFYIFKPYQDNVG